MKGSLLLPALLLSLCARACGADGPPAADPRSPVHGVLGDYDLELRTPDGHVDAAAMVGRLKALGANTYFWLVWHAATDWEDLRLFLPKAAAAGIGVWVYLVPPSESPPNAEWYSEPFRVDYQRWGEEIARLSLEHPNLKAWVIDDFLANRQLLSPAYLREMQARAKQINPRLAFLPLMYFNETTPGFVRDYRDVIDGVVIAYPRDRQEIEHAHAVLDGEVIAAAPGTFAYPGGTPSTPGDFAMAAQTAGVLPGARYGLRFREWDDFPGPTAGYHFKQLLVDDAVVWEQDVAGGSTQWREVVVDVTEQVRGKQQVTLGFRMLDKKGVSQFPVRWAVRGLRAGGLRLAAGLDQPEKWAASKRGAFEMGFGLQPKRAGPKPAPIPFILMTAAQETEFKGRHGDPASPERIAEWLRMSLQAWRDGKCDGVVTYCLDKTKESKTFAPIQAVFRRFRGK